ncbi:hypothetical protein KSP39_PZI009409 [Platanthera zijinensis]|uniref:CCHC-type domain-containing protein n=1 Tax=Platanthera zijinensis TaxID=2320716 RepID=A0AAP0BL04_9ASPA
MTEVTAATGSTEEVRVWRKMNAKAAFTLKRAISPELFDHIIGCQSAAEIWTSLDGLFNKKNVARLQFLENELARVTQGDLSISTIFLKLKNLCAEISTLDHNEPNLEAKLKRHIISGMQKEYVAFVTSVQGWATQPSLLELENLLASHESLARQMASMAISRGDSEVLFSGKKKRWDKKNKSSGSDGPSTSYQEKSSSSKKNGKKEGPRCYRCNLPGHFKRDCKVKVQSGHAAGKGEAGFSTEEGGWGNAFITGTCVCAMSTVNYQDD